MPDPAPGLPEVAGKSAGQEAILRQDAVERDGDRRSPMHPNAPAAAWAVDNRLRFRFLGA
jgi:hypothetical protein